MVNASSRTPRDVRDGVRWGDMRDTRQTPWKNDTFVSDRARLYENHKNTFIQLQKIFRSID